MTRAVVFGGSGMLGHRVVREGRRRGHAVLGLSSAQADLTDPDRLAWWTERFRPEVVFNCAAMTVVDDCESEEERANAINGAGAGHAAEAARRVGARCLHVSTDYVFDGAGTEPYRTDDPTGPISAYGRSKLAGEEAVLAAGETGGTTVVRTSWLFGPGDGPSFPKTMLRLIEEGRTPLRVVDDQVGAPTYTPYLAAALWELAEIGGGDGSKVDGVFHYQNREAISWCGFAREIARSWAPRSEGRAGVEVVPVTTDEFPRPAPRPAYSVLDVSRFEALTGTPVASWRTGLGIHLDHLRACRPRPARVRDSKTREENEVSQ